MQYRVQRNKHIHRIAMRAKTNRRKGAQANVYTRCIPAARVCPTGSTFMYFVLNITRGGGNQT